MIHPHPRLTLSFKFGDVSQDHRCSSCAKITIRGQSLAVTPVFHAYWRFAAERQNIFFRRLQQRTADLTIDPVLERFRFTNAYRASDRVSQYLIRHVIYRDDLPSDNVNLFFRILLFKLFNKIETWQVLEEELGPITWERFEFDRYDAVLTRTKGKGDRIYSAAYIMPSGRSAFGHQAKHRNHLRLIESAVQNGYPARLAGCTTMSRAFALLRSIPTIGPFLAYQYVTDLNYSTLLNFGEDEFVVAGPGALDGIDKCFEGASRVSAADVICYMYENQEWHFADLQIEFPSLWGRRLQLVDCQNVFCEISKYARVAFPEYAGVAGRTRIKQKFSIRGDLPPPWYPPKWGLNEKIQSDLFLDVGHVSNSRRSADQVV
jgi:5-hmdU DNA kinase, helical domain